MKDINKYTTDRLEDWIINCDICGSPCWHSESTELDIDTGLGGALVCKRHIFPIDYGLVPYKIPAEQGVTETRILQNFNDTNATNDIVGDTPFDLDNNDPLSSN